MMEFRWRQFLAIRRALRKIPGAHVPNIKTAMRHGVIKKVGRGKYRA